MKRQWLRDLTDFAVMATVLGLLACFIFVIVGYYTTKSPDPLFTYGGPIAVGVGVLDAIAIGLNLKFNKPTPMRAGSPRLFIVEPSDRLEIAEAYIREQTGLYRHYCIPEVQRHVKQWRYASLTEDEAVSIVQKIRDEFGMGPIADYNMPGYVDPDEFIDLSGM